MIKRFFSPPEFINDEEKNRIAKLLHQLILASWLLPILAALVIIISPQLAQFVLPAGGILALVLLVLMETNHRGYTKQASYALVGTLYLVLTYLNYVGAGEARPMLVLSVVSIMVSGLLLGSRDALITAFLLALQNAVIVILRENGFIIPRDQQPGALQNILVISLSYMLIGFMFHLAVSRVQAVITQIRTSEKNLQVSNRNLQTLSSSLEQRVAQRTKELEEQQRLALRRSRQFEGITRVSKAITTTKNLEVALPQITNVISEQFGFYHVGIFLIDSANLYAVLSASNSEGGKKMIARGHQLKIGEQGIVGYATKTGKSRIALDVGADAHYFNNAELPYTHSEAALPLKIDEVVIGALDIQSEEINAFTNEDIEALETLADQVSLSIQNARLFDQTEKSLAESDAIQRQYLRETWTRLPKEENLAGYRYSAIGATQINNEETITPPDDSFYKEIAAPISIRGETIGQLTIHVPRHERVSTDQMDLIKAVADRVALSAENARLFEETSRRASRESLVSDITTKIRGTNSPQEMIKTAVEELQRALGASRVEIIPRKNPISPDK